MVALEETRENIINDWFWTGIEGEIEEKQTEMEEMACSAVKKFSEPTKIALI